MDSFGLSAWSLLLGITTILALSVAISAMGVFPSKNQMPVDGKTVLLTGASEGMGRAAACQLAAKGANVIIVSRNAARMQEALVDIRAAARRPDAQRFHYLTADVSQPDFAEPLLRDAVAWNRGQPLDVVWCVAGMSTPDLWVEAPLALTRRQMDVNFWGSAELAHAVLRLWTRPEAPVVPEPKHLVFTSSVLAFVPILGYGPYNPAKGALRALADTLVQELRLYPQDVRVHVVFPGSISSPGMERENRTKPEITRILEDGDPVQTPDDVAAKAIAGLERGQYFVTVAFLGHVMRWASMGPSPRNSWLVDTVMSWVVSFAMMFAISDMNGKIKKYGAQNGHPSTFRAKEAQQAS